MRILKSFRYAVKGIKYCISNERNMRIHTVATVYVLAFSPFFKFSKFELVMLILTILSVVAAEMVNTAVEGLSDIFVSEYNVAAKNIKDVAAGAVFISAVASVVVGAILFSDVESYVRIYNFFCLYPFNLLILGVFTFLSVIYVYYGPFETINKIKNFLKINKKV